MSEYVSSCKSISRLEAFCEHAVKAGKAKLVHNGHADGIDCFSRDYDINLKNSIYPAKFHFWYDSRKRDNSVRKDVAGISFTIEDLIQVLYAFINKEFTIDLPELLITMGKTGLHIEQR